MSFKGIEIRLPPNAVFFDSRELMQEVDQAERNALSKFGAFTRSDARKSMRRGKRPSRPGETPRVVRGFVKRFLFFAYDRFKASVVVGPALLTGFKDAGKALPALEHGEGMAARPFMGPAFERQVDQHIPQLWRDSIK